MFKPIIYNFSADQKLNVYKRLLVGLKPYLWIIILSIISLIIAKSIEAASLKFLVPKLPDLFQKVVIEKSKNNSLNFIPLMLLLAALFRASFGFTTKFLIGYLTKSFSRDLRGKILSHMLLLPVEFFKQNAIGSLISKVNYDVEQVIRALADSILELLSSLVTIMFFISVMFSFSWHLTILALIIAPLISWFLKAINLRIRRYSNRLQQSVGNVSHLAHEIIEACQIIRIFEAIDQENHRINNLIKDNFKQELKIVLVSALSESIMLFSLGAVFVLLIYLAITNNLSISTGEFVGLFGAMYGLIRPLKQLSQVNNVIARGIAAADSIFELLEVPTENYTKHSFKNIVIEPEKPKEVGSNGAKLSEQQAINIILQNVSFYYPNKKNQDLQNILSEININFPANKTTAIIGRSGSGKSTLVALLPKLYQVTHGNIYLNQININDIDLYNLRKYFSMVTQRTILLNDTVANNIAYGCMQNATQEQIIKAAELANAMEFIQELPQGLETIIGNNGNLLSGGQRQRLALARAILKDAPILILDEATSALDNQSEQKIQVELNELTTNKTTIVIAHRMSTIENADQIVILEAGKIVGIGKHSELINNKYYNDLCKVAVN